MLYNRYIKGNKRSRQTKGFKEMKFYVAITKFTDGETVTLSFDSIEAMNEWHNSLSKYIDKVIAKVLYTDVDGNRTAAELL